MNVEGAKVMIFILRRIVVNKTYDKTFSLAMLPIKTLSLLKKIFQPFAIMHYHNYFLNMTSKYHD